MGALGLGIGGVAAAFLISFMPSYNYFANTQSIVIGWAAVGIGAYLGWRFIPR